MGTNERFDDVRSRRGRVVLVVEVEFEVASNHVVEQAVSERVVRVSILPGGWALIGYRVVDRVRGGAEQCSKQMLRLGTVHLEGEIRLDRQRLGLRRGLRHGTSF